MRVVRNRKKRFSLPRNCWRANTYAAGTPTTSESSVVPAAMNTLFHTSGAYSLRMNTSG